MNIKELRLSLGLSQKKFGARIGVDKLTVRRWEKGKHLPSPMARRAIKEVFGVEERGQPRCTTGSSIGVGSASDGTGDRISV